MRRRPFLREHGAKKSALPGGRDLRVPTAPRSGDAKTAAGGFVVSDDGWIVTASSAVQNCVKVLIGSFGEAGDLRVSADLPIAAVHLPNIGVLSPLGLSVKVPSYLAKVSTIGFLSDDHLGQHPMAIAASFLSYAGGPSLPQYAQVSGVIEPGNEGGPLVDDAGGVLGVLVNKHAVVENLGSTQELSDLASYAVREELLVDFLTRNRIRPATRVPDGTTPGGLPDIPRGSIVPVVCMHN